MYTDSHLSSPSPHGHARPVGKHASGNVHRGQLLEQKLGCIRDMHLGDSVLVVTQSTLEESLLQFSVIPSSLAHIVRQIQGCLSTYATGVIKPQSSQMCTRKGSDTSNNRSFRNALAPCAIIQSRSISPNRRPPSRARPSTGCRVKI